MAKAQAKTSNNSATSIFTVEETTNEGLERGYTVSVSAEHIASAVDAELTRIASQVKVPGFRPGKVPLSLMRKRYGESVEADALQRAMQQAVNHVVASKDIRPALSPEVNITSYESGSAMVLSIVFQVMPDVPEISVDDISLTKYAVEPDSAEVEKSLESIAQMRKHFHTRDGKAESGDQVIIDFEGFVDGEAFEGGKAEAFKLELGSGRFIDGFEDQLIGAKAGDELDVSVTFPEEYHAENLKGKPAIFKVKVHLVEYPHVPEMNDKLAESIGFKTVDEVREFLKGRLNERSEDMARQLLKKELFDALDARCNFPVPAGMLKLEEEAIAAQAQPGADATGELSAEDKQECSVIANRRVRLGIYLATIARENKLDVSQEELNQALRAEMMRYPNQQKQVLEYYQSNPERINELRGPILEEKAVDFLLEKVSVTTVTITAEELEAKLQDDIQADADKAEKPAKKPAAKAKKKTTKADDTTSTEEK